MFSFEIWRAVAMRIIELSDMLRELEHERVCVVSTYSNAPAYRDAVLEGLRLAEVIARDSTTAGHCGSGNTAHNRPKRTLKRSAVGRDVVVNYQPTLL
jgi:hypothetical protein